MKTPLALLAALLLAAFASAQESFPGLKAILTPAEWQRAGLDRLSPDELGVIDAALIRHARASQAQLQSALATARAETATAQAAEKSAARRGLLERFGLPVFDNIDWRDFPPLKAKVVAWETKNRFRLENGQVWEGNETIPFELIGREIEIHARPHGQFALVIDGKSTSIRVIRLR